MTGPSPFAVLGLPASGELTDDDVRAAWRRVAAATHPDRADGGDPAAFAAAAAAYTALRTRAGRAEALADMRQQVAGPRKGGPVPRRWHLLVPTVTVGRLTLSRIAQGLRGASRCGRSASLRRATWRSPRRAGSRPAPP